MVFSRCQATLDGTLGRRLCELTRESVAMNAWSHENSQGPFLWATVCRCWAGNATERRLLVMGSQACGVNTLKALHRFIRHLLVESRSCAVRSEHIRIEVMFQGFALQTLQRSLHSDAVSGFHMTKVSIGILSVSCRANLGNDMSCSMRVFNDV